MHKLQKEDRRRKLHSNKLKDFWKYLNSLHSTRNDIIPSLEEFNHYFKDVSVDVDDSEFCIDDDEHIFNSRISENEIFLAIKNLKTRKDAGFDGMLNEYLKNTVPNLNHFYVKLFDIVFDKGLSPDI